MDNEQNLPPSRQPAAFEPPANEPPQNRRAMWLSMGAVLLALVLLTLVPELGHEEFPPPPADLMSAEAGDENAVFVGLPAKLDFTLKDMHGIDVELESFRGKVILLNFWATWCGPCKAEIPSLVELQDEYEGDLVVLGFSVDDPVEKLLPYAAEYGINYPVLVGDGREDVQDAYGPLWGIPVSVIIGRDGKIAKKHSGIASKEEFEQEINALL